MTKRLSSVGKVWLVSNGVNATNYYALSLSGCLFVARTILVTNQALDGMLNNCRI